MIEGNGVYIVYCSEFDDSWRETRSVRTVFSEDGFSSFKKDAIKVMRARTNETKTATNEKLFKDFLNKNNLTFSYMGIINKGNVNDVI